MRIVRLTAENVKRLHAVDIAPDGDVVVISGRNGAGKSSVLDAIWMALGGGSAQVPEPIRRGADEALVRLDLGDMIVTRRWSTDKKSSLRVEAKDGARYQQPQSLLDSLVGRIAFDPLAFAMQDRKTQLQWLINLVDLPFDPSEHEAERNALYEQRTISGRHLRDLRGALEAMPRPPADLPDEELSTVAILDALQEAERALAHIADLQQRRETAIREAERADDEITRLHERIRELTAERTKYAYTAEQLAGDIASQPAPPDRTRFREELQEVESLNRAIREHRERQRLVERVAAAEREVAEYTKAITDFDERKERALQQAKMPVEGLGFNAEGVTFQGLPFAQCSSAEQLRVSVAIAMAMNPTLRVLRIADGSLLDSRSMAILTEMAGARDFQVWVEVVDETGAVGIHIEDGAVSA